MRVVLQESGLSVQKTPYIAAKNKRRQGSPMRMVYHLGAHCTDDERLIRCLLKNREVLAQQGIIVPAPQRYRTLLRDTAIQLKGTPASAEMQASLLEQIVPDGSVERLIFSWEHFLGLPNWALDGVIYPAAGDRVRAFAQIFPDVPAEFHLALRNPATFLPALVAKQTKPDVDKVFAGTDPLDWRWSDTIRRIITVNPGIALTVWCDEDTPLIWPEVLQAVSGHGADTTLDGVFDVLASIMTADGLKRLRAYLDTKGPFTPDRRRRAVTAFLDKFARPDQLEVQIDVPGWTQALVARMSEAYEQDVALIAQMPGVTFIAP
jgi:hypothetical protein